MEKTGRSRKVVLLQFALIILGIWTLCLGLPAKMVRPANYPLQVGGLMMTICGILWYAIDRRSTWVFGHKVLLIGILISLFTIPFVIPYLFSNHGYLRFIGPLFMLFGVVYLGFHFFLKPNTKPPQSPAPQGQPGDTK